MPLISAATLALVARRSRGRRTANVVVPPPLPPTKRRLPQINTATCLGCYACVDACPFDVIEIHKFVAVVERPADCCGVVACREVCPNGSLTISEDGMISGVPRVTVSSRSRKNDAGSVFVFLAVLNCRLILAALNGIEMPKNGICEG